MRTKHCYVFCHAMVTRELILYLIFINVQILTNIIINKRKNCYFQLQNVAIFYFLWDFYNEEIGTDEFLIDFQST